MKPFCQYLLASDMQYLLKSVIEMRQSKGLYAPHCKGSCSQKVDFHGINDTIYVQTHKWVFQLMQTYSPILQRRILLKGFYYIIYLCNGFYNIIEFIKMYEWIISVACIFEHIGHVQLICMMREKKLFQIFCEFCAMYEEWRELKLWNV